MEYIVDNNHVLVEQKLLGYEEKGLDQLHLTKNDAVIIAIKNEGVTVVEQLNQQRYMLWLDYILFEDLLTIVKIL